MKVTDDHLNVFWTAFYADKGTFTDSVKSGIAAVAPQIARTALERAALLVENRGCRSDDCCDDIPRLAAAIRALPDE